MENIEEKLTESLFTLDDKFDIVTDVVATDTPNVYEVTLPSLEEDLLDQVTDYLVEQGFSVAEDVARSTSDATLLLVSEAPVKTTLTSSKVGDIADQLRLGQLLPGDALTLLRQEGYNLSTAKKLVEKWASKMLTQAVTLYDVYFDWYDTNGVKHSNVDTVAAESESGARATAISAYHDNPVRPDVMIGDIVPYHVQLHGASSLNNSVSIPMSLTADNDVTHEPGAFADVTPVEGDDSTYQLQVVFEDGGMATLAYDSIDDAKNAGWNL